MDQARIEEKIKQIARPVVEAEGYEFYDANFISGSRVAQIFIDRTEGGVNLDDCAKISRALSLLFDVEDVVPGSEYSLEVSSPGLERVLREKWHYERQLGKGIKVTLKSRSEAASKIGKKAFLGSISEVTEEGIRLDLDGENPIIDFEDIHKAKLLFDYDKNFPAKGK